jgi:hypothetical protein
VHSHPLGLAGRLPLDTTIGVAAHQQLFLGVHADDRLASGQLLLGLLVDIPKLRIPVGMLGALLGLEGVLQRVALLLEQPADGVAGDLEALRDQGVGELAGCFAHEGWSG